MGCHSLTDSGAAEDDDSWAVGETGGDGGDVGGDKAG